jgi:hypothetical protein
MNAAEKFAQDSFIAQMAATLLAGEFASNEGRGCPFGDSPDPQEHRRVLAKESVALARAIYNAATDARIKGDTQ